MADISAKLVKELRDKTGAGMMDCKKALVENEGNSKHPLSGCGKKVWLRQVTKVDELPQKGS